MIDCFELEVQDEFGWVLEGHFELRQKRTRKVITLRPGLNHRLKVERQAHGLIETLEVNEVPDQGMWEVRDATVDTDNNTVTGFVQYTRGYKDFNAQEEFWIVSTSPGEFMKQADQRRQVLFA